jgi:hypothetical protein
LFFLFPLPLGFFFAGGCTSGIDRTSSMEGRGDDDSLFDEGYGADEDDEDEE